QTIDVKRLTKQLPYAILKPCSLFGTAAEIRAGASQNNIGSDRCRAAAAPRREKENQNGK
ncbi:MAG: hypothetical protein ACLUHM_06065, partial [Bifidobacterium adolescentis]